jgi:hypothetical protein
MKQVFVEGFDRIIIISASKLAINPKIGNQINMLAQAFRHKTLSSPLAQNMGLE